jgi:protein-disulfide isomerase
VAGTYGVTATPTMFVLDRNGVVTQKIVGAQGYAALAAALDSVLGG